MHVHQTSSSPERQTGVRRLILRLWIFFLERVHAHESSRPAKRFNFDDFIDAEHTQRPKGVNVTFRCLNIFNKEYPSDYETIRETCPHIFGAIAEEAGVEVSRDNCVSDADFETRTWFKALMLEKSEVATSAKEMYFSEVM